LFGVIDDRDEDGRIAAMTIKAFCLSVAHSAPSEPKEPDHG